MQRYYRTISKAFIWMAIFSFSAFCAFAQNKAIPAGYYSNASGLSGAQLKTALYNIIKGHTDLGYDGLYNAYKTTDVIVINGESKVYDMYSVKADGTATYYFSHTSGDQCGSYNSEGDCYNREHSFPQSWFGSGTPKSDAFQVYPTDGYVNNRRSNYPYGEVTSPTWTSSNGSKLGTCSYPGYSGTVFEPIDEFKGDFARTYFYMATRYENNIAGWPGSAMLNGTSYPCFTTWALNMLIEWSNQDPVSEKEIARNEAVYSLQHNRNPFIDHPEYVAQIWGGNSSPAFNNLVLSPATPSATDVVNVSVQVTDAEGISSVSLQWGTASGSLSNTISMTLTSGTTYNSASAITAQSAGTSVYYRFSVVDQAGITATSSVYSYTIAGGGGGSNTTVTLFSDNFEDGTLNKWTTQNVTGTQAWTVDAVHGVSNSKCAKMSGYEGSSNANEDWLLTPAINFTGITGAKMVFQTACSYTGLDIELKYSTNYSGTGSPASATWTNLTGITLSPGTFAWTASGNIDLSSVTGSAVYFAFVYKSTSTESKTWEIDEVVIDGTKNTTDTSAPVLTLEPANGDNNIPAEQAIIVSANEALFTASQTNIDATYLANMIHVSIGDAQGAAVANSAVINDARTEITITPTSNWSYSTTYFISIDANSLSDASGNKIVSVITAQFTTMGQPDVSAPQISINPTNGSADIPVNQHIIISTNEPVFVPGGGIADNTYVQSVVVLKKGSASGENVAFTASIADSKSTMTIVPTINLDAQTVYYVAILANSFEDAEGNLQTSLINAQFTTALGADQAAPVFAGATLGADWRTITLSFDEPIAMNTVDMKSLHDSILLAIADNQFSPIGSDVQVSLSNKNLVITFPANLVTATNIIKVKAGSIKDLFGNVLLSDVISPALDATGSDTQAPTYLTDYPVADSITSNQVVLKVKMNEPGKVFYTIKKKSDAAPTKAQVLAGSYLAIAEANMEYFVKIEQLTDYTAYVIYLLTQDNHTVVNTSAYLSKLNFTTLAVTPVINLKTIETEKCPGDIAELSVESTGTSPIVYTWYFNNQAINLSNLPTLTLNNVSAEMAGAYYCVAENIAGTDTSETGTLIVLPLTTAGADNTVTLKDTTPSFDLSTLISEGATTGGTWLETTTSGALQGSVLNPAVTGTGIFEFIYQTTGPCNTDEAVFTVTIEATEGIYESQLIGIRIWPIPSTGEIHLEAKETINVAMNIYQYDGKIIDSKTNINLDETGFLLNLHRQGVYFIQMISNGVSETRKVVIE